MIDVYLKAWSILHKKVDEKTGWVGKAQFKEMMLESLIEAGEETKENWYMPQINREEP